MVSMLAIFSFSGCGYEKNAAFIPNKIEIQNQQPTQENVPLDKSVQKTKNIVNTSKKFKIIGNGMSFDVPLWEKEVDKEFSTIFCSETNEFLAIVRVPVDYRNDLKYLYTFTNNQFVFDAHDDLDIEAISAITEKSFKTEKAGLDVFKTTGEVISGSGERVGYVVSYTFVYKKLPITVFCGDINGETSKSDTKNINKTIENVIDSIEDIS